MSKHDPRPIQEVLEAVRKAEVEKLEEANLPEVSFDSLSPADKAQMYKLLSKGMDLPYGSPAFKKNKAEIDKLRKKLKLDERAALVMNQTHIIDVVLKDLHAMLLKQMGKGQLELMNNVARMVGLKVTTKGQGKNKAFMYDLEKGFKRK